MRKAVNAGRAVVRKGRRRCVEEEVNLTGVGGGLEDKEQTHNCCTINLGSPSLCTARPLPRWFPNTLDDSKGWWSQERGSVFSSEESAFILSSCVGQ